MAAESSRAPQRAREIMAGASAVTALTGAGISTASGIPDFRGPQGVWTNNPAAARMFDIEAYLADPDLRAQAWRSRSEHPAWRARPNDGHRALVDLERQGRLRALVTQNIDELHQSAGSGLQAPVLEVHGSLKRAVCLSCGWRGTMEAVLARVAAGEADPPCEVCGGILKSDTVSFGQSLDRQLLRESARAAAECDVLLAVGTSLQVNPVAGLVPLAHEAGAEVVIVNAEPTPFDAIAGAVVRGQIEQVLPELVAA